MALLCSCSNAPISSYLKGRLLLLGYKGKCDRMMKHNDQRPAAEKLFKNYAPACAYLAVQPHLFLLLLCLEEIYHSEEHNKSKD